MPTSMLITSNKEKPLLSEYTASDIHNSLNAMINALDGLATDVQGLRSDIHDLRTEMKTNNERDARQDQQIWTEEGQVRLNSVQSDISRVQLQIKGLWAANSLIITVLISWIVTHIKF